jgi:transketolase
MGIAPLDQKYRAFNWNVIECDGHHWDDILQAYAEAGRLYRSGRPTVIIFHTVMGKGVSFMEGKAEWHGKPPKGDEVTRALSELGTTEAEWRADLLRGA